MRVQLNQVHKNFEQEEIFHISDYEFKENRINGIIGDNGAGKTTLLRMISGLDRNFKGEIKYNNRLYSKELVKDMTYVSQKSYMMKRSVFENIAYPLKIRKYSKDMILSNVDFYLKRLGIEHLRNRSAEVLSSGERQKVALARALIFEPKLLLLDEPTANIDPDTVQILEELLRDFQGMTKGNIIIVTHSIDQALGLCDEVSLLRGGKLEECSQAYLRRCTTQIDRVNAVNYKRHGV